MSTQTVYFTNPSVISGLQSTTTTIQSQIGLTGSQINTSLINLTTGAVRNLSVNYFVDQFTVDKGLGPYQVDAIPICFNDIFTMPKFSRNLLATSSVYGGTGSTGGSDGISYTTQLYDTFNYSDIVIYAPSSRTGALVTTNVFQQDTVNECNNLGGFGAPLQDFRGVTAVTATGTEFSGIFGSTGLGYLYGAFYDLCSSASSTTGARNAALNAITSHPDYITIKNNIKYPFKVWNQIKNGTGSFQFENLLDLNGTPITTTGASGLVSYNCQITSTTYSSTGNLLPIAQDINATDQGKYGLLLIQLPDFGTTQYITLAHQIASLGYIVVVAQQNPLSSTFCKYGDVVSYTKRLADSNLVAITASNVNTSTALTNSHLTGAYLCPRSLYDTGADNLFTNAGATGYYRLESRNNMATVAGQQYIERYFYLIKCVLQKLGIGAYIDYNAIVHMAYSQAGQSLAAGQRLTDNSGNAKYFKQMNGTLPFLFKQRAMINMSCVFDEASLLRNSMSNAYSFNNRLSMGINTLSSPMISVLPDGDYGFNLSQNVFRFLDQAQTIYQNTKLSTTWAGALNHYQKSAVFYRPVAGHLDHLSDADIGVPGQGNAGTFYDVAFQSDLVHGWHLPSCPTFPSSESFYESNTKDNVLVAQLNIMKIHNLVQMISHRFLYSINASATSGRGFPIGPEIYPMFGLKYDLQPTFCDNITDYEYLRVGPVTKLSYDTNYNLVLTTNAYQTSSTLNQGLISFIATGSTGYFRNLVATTDLTAPTISATTFTGANASITSLTGSTAYFNSITVNTGVFSSIVYQNETIVNSVTTNEVVQNLTGTNASISNLNITSNLKVTNTIASGTGAITANTPVGQVIFGSSDASLVITNSLVTPSSIIIATVATNDTTLKSVVAEAGSGSFTLTPNAQSTNDTKVNWMVIN